MTKEQLEQAIRNYMKLYVCPKCVGDSKIECPYINNEDCCDKAKVEENENEKKINNKN